MKPVLEAEVRQGRFYPRHDPEQRGYTREELEDRGYDLLESSLHGVLAGNRPEPGNASRVVPVVRFQHRDARLPESDPSRDRDLYHRLLAINQEAFDARRYTVAYHALAGAEACARELEGDESLRTAEGLAHEQAAWIDAHAPQDEHSTAAAARRRRIHVFAILARQAGRTVQARQARRQMRDRGLSRFPHPPGSYSGLS